MNGLGLSVQGLMKTFDGRPVIRHLNLEVSAGQFVAIVGRSGCGKSTLLRLLSSLDQPSAGGFSFLEEDGRAAPSGQARIMFQEPRLLPWASVLDNVAIGLSGMDIPVREAQARALTALQNAGLGDRPNHWPAVLSGGQKQRVALARALVSRPRFLALDEPLGALDALTRIEMQSLIEQVHREQGFTAVLVTHDVREALTLADRVIMIEDGVIALDLAVDLPRPRPRVSNELAEIENHILSRLLIPAGSRAA